MTLREILIERILFAVSEQELMRHYQMTESELLETSDLDLFELYESIYLDQTV